MYLFTLAVANPYKEIHNLQAVTMYMKICPEHHDSCTQRLAYLSNTIRQCSNPGVRLVTRKDKVNI